MVVNQGLLYNGSEMKVFVSGQLEEKERIRSVFDRLIERGFSVTHDWTRTDDLQDKLGNPVECGRRAEKDIRGVMECDLYILMSDNQRVGKGMYVELGAALALHSSTNRPEICVVGPMNHLSIFYLHPNVKSFNSIEELFVAIDGPGVAQSDQSPMEVA